MAARCIPEISRPQESGKRTPWGYALHNGPLTWSKNYPSANGRRQSPINIATSLANEIRPENRLSWQYEPDGCTELVNTGVGWEMKFKKHSSALHGGPIQGEYELRQFHCHWGKTDVEGSEHAIDGTKYSAELHFVHWSPAKYETLPQSLEHEDGIIVIAVFLKAGKAHRELDKIIKLLPKVRKAGSKLEISESQSVDPSAFYPKRSMCYSYPGSLTAPPCSECVTWIVLEEPIEVSSEQLQVMRTLKSICVKNKSCTNVTENIRPFCPLGGRTIGKFELRKVKCGLPEE